MKRRDFVDMVEKMYNCRVLFVIALWHHWVSGKDGACISELPMAWKNECVLSLTSRYYSMTGVGRAVGSVAERSKALV